ncbi:MAG TPA: Imm42 family immunity protein [Schlesneria sp.]|jgi:hypothetical protein
MMIGDPATFAIESRIATAYDGSGIQALGLFVIHVGGFRYGVYQDDASMLGNSFDEVGSRLARRGQHTAPFAALDAAAIADAYRGALYCEVHEDHYLGLPRQDFENLIYDHQITWAPDGDECFDDGSYVLQFDVGDRVRLIAFRTVDWLHDPATLRDVWLATDDYYGILKRWQDAFQVEWRSALKKQQGSI